MSKISSSCLFGNFIAFVSDMQLGRKLPEGDFGTWGRGPMSYIAQLCKDFCDAGLSIAESRSDEL